MKFYILSPSTVPLNPCLFPAFIPYWEKQGWQRVDRIEDAEVVLWDLHSRIGEYEQSDLNYVVENKIKVAVFCEWDRGLMSSDIYPNPLTYQQALLFHQFHRNEIKSIHFCRLLDKTDIPIDYELLPYEKGILHSEHQYSPDELFNREYDIVYIANTAPSREKIAMALRLDGRLKCKIMIGETKIPFNDFLNEHRNGKLFISSGGGGFTDERCQALYSIAGIIRENSNQLLLHDFTDCVNSIRIDNPPTKQDLDKIVEIVNNKERLYSIYKKGIEFMEKYWSNSYIANDILEKINKHL